MSCFKQVSAWRSTVLSLSIQLVFLEDETTFCQLEILTVRTVLESKEEVKVLTSKSHLTILVFFTYFQK